jgi:hypothetical protein
MGLISSTNQRGDKLFQCGTLSSVEDGTGQFKNKNNPILHFSNAQIKPEKRFPPDFHSPKKMDNIQKSITLSKYKQLNIL